ncbi:MAG: DUF1552 domain-containing protein [Verrucomicrobiales bacterium]|nr:DUF1552 domain-containing protein [Verrucomicrobiales bacterium]
MAKTWKISRRRVLRGLGATLALPYLEVMGNDGLSKTLPPVRLCCVFQPNGMYPAAWDAGVPRENQEKALSVLSPLSAHDQGVTRIAGLDNVGRGHVQLTSSFLSGVPVIGKKAATSLDQKVAQHLEGKTLFSSLVLGTEPPRQGNASGEPISYANTVSWSSSDTRLSPEIHPQQVFDRLFRSRTHPAARRQQEGRRSVLDFVLEDSRRLKKKVSQQDSKKIDEYLAGVRQVEQRIENSLNPPEREWIPPSQPEFTRPDALAPEDREAYLQVMADLMVLAFQTDSTRVGTWMMAHGFSRLNFSFLEGVNGDHHAMSHHKNKSKVIDEYVMVSRWYVKRFGYLLDKMSAVDEGNGSLLDNSVVLFGSGMKDGNGHVPNDLPLLLAGGAGGRLKHGRKVIEHPAGTPHANLLLSLAQMMGMDLDHFNGVSSGTVEI